MNKQELAIVVVLFALLLGWGFIQRAVSPPPAPPPPEPAASGGAVSGETELAAGTNAGGADADAAAIAAAAEEELIGEDDVALEPEAAPAVPEPAEPERRIDLFSEHAEVTVSTWGAVVTGVRLKEYRETLEEESPPVTLDFTNRPALEIDGIAGLTPRNAFDASLTEDARTLTLRRTAAGGLSFERILVLHDDYRLTITDTLANTGRLVLNVPAHGVGVGFMQTIRGASKMRGMTYLGADTLYAAAGKEVEHWGKKKIPGLFGQETGFLSCARPDPTGMPPSVLHTIDEPLSWLGVKNKFFVQLLAPAAESAGGFVGAKRDMDSKGFELTAVWGGLRFEGAALQPGDALTHTMEYYVGPKKYALLKTLGRHQDDVMEFGWFSWLCKPLLWTLNRIHALIPNYGLAIILLTALVRIVFWPITHKSTESMKKMQKLQPLVTEIREKHKNNPQKMNQEVMALYKEHKANPMAGCLPMVIQIPVFIALFTVLRSAIELRFAEFLWIRDLSEPEGLLSGVLPIPLNILPLFMTATMVWQQRLTPTAGDPQQQKMMMIMPVVMLFIFYSMPSALVLYWSTSQCLAIAQLLTQRRKTAREETGTPAAPARSKAAKSR